MPKFFLVHNDVPYNKPEKISEFCPVFVVKEINYDKVVQHIKKYIKKLKKIVFTVEKKKVLQYCLIMA